jgi:GR25 family glycosyltransferase involved in LPS biosynthesis
MSRTRPKRSSEKRRRCPNGSRRNRKTARCEKKTDKTKDTSCPPGKVRNPKTKRCRKAVKTPTTQKTLKALPQDKQYNIYIICKNKTIFNDRVKTLQKYKGKIHKFHFVKAVFLKDTKKNREETKKLNTRYNTLMKNRLRKLGCIYAHRNALRQIVKNQTNDNVILEEDATLDHVLPNPPKQSAYLGGWIIPPQISLAGKKRMRVPNLKNGLNEIDYDKFRVLMAHAYYMKSHELAKKILDVIEGPKKVKNYDIFLIDHKFFNKFYYPAIFVQSRHFSDIEGKVNKNDLRTKNYGLDYEG